MVPVLGQSSFLGARPAQSPLVDIVVATLQRLDTHLPQIDCGGCLRCRIVRRNSLLHRILLMRVGNERPARLFVRRVVVLPDFVNLF